MQLLNPLTSPSLFLLAMTDLLKYHSDVWTHRGATDGTYPWILSIENLQG